MATNDTGSAQSVEPTANDDSGSGFGMIPRRLRGTLTAHEIAIYVALSWRADDFGECWLRLHRLADEAGTSHSTAKRALATLRAKGIVDWRPRHGRDGSVECNVYRLLVFRTRESGQSDPGVGSQGPTEREPLNETPTALPSGEVPDKSVTPSPPPSARRVAPCGDDLRALLRKATSAVLNSSGCVTGTEAEDAFGIGFLSVDAHNLWHHRLYTAVERLDDLDECEATKDEVKGYIRQQVNQIANQVAKVHDEVTPPAATEETA